MNRLLHLGPKVHEVKSMLVSLFHRLLWALQPIDKIEAFGGPKEVGEAVVRTIKGPHPDMKGTLTESSSRENSVKAG
ncbi:hypothetical protein NC651_029701 [Populus alba x Populus x berolinensis]|nr:hypothetical protein NC651_029690 [Populus alba x Populus x berolinensis]KAJ6876775.1 hypothetical protein NC651_029701 [Populus alba x Populus x berolinensis]